MKTHAIEWNGPEFEKRQERLNTARGLSVATRVVSRVVLALAPAMAMVIIAAWLVTLPGLAVYLQAGLWASGFVFFGLALESDKATIGLSVLTGFALPLLAWLSSTISLSFLIIAVGLVAAWIATSTWKLTAAKSPTSGQY
jgi:hypothetical protein